MSMDRDDRGNYLDTITVDGVKTVNPLNQETVSIRRSIPGEYVVNVYKFSDDSGAPTPVSVKVEKINPRVSVVSYWTVTLRAREKLSLFLSEALLRLALLGTAIGFILMLIPP
jgi:hypothetical protein